MLAIMKRYFTLPCGLVIFYLLLQIPWIRHYTHWRYFLTWKHHGLPQVSNLIINNDFISINVITPVISITFNVHYTVNCEWGPWSSEGKCSATCGTGEKTLRRSILTKAQNGGSSCIGKSIIVQKCNLPPCPGKCTLLSFILLSSIL